LVLSQVEKTAGAVGVEDGDVRVECLPGLYNGLGVGLDGLGVVLCIEVSVALLFQVLRGGNWQFWAGHRNKAALGS